MNRSLNPIKTSADLLVPSLSPSFLVAFMVCALLGLGCGEDQPTRPKSATYMLLPDGNGDFSTIQAAVNAANDGDTLKLGTGTFQGPGNVDVDYIGKAITIMSQSGNPDSCIIDCAGSVNDPHRGFVFQSGEGSNSRLVGVTISNGFAASQGGAILCLNGSNPTLISCRFLTNEAGNRGGGVYCNGSSPALVDCVFQGNVAPRGGGLACDDSPALMASDCLFSENRALAPGGGVALLRSSSEFKGCTFTSNTAEDGFNNGGGAIYAQNFSTLLLERCIVSLNTARFGGGISCELGTSASLVSCTLYSNMSTDGIGGGVVLFEGSTLIMENSIVASSTGGEAIHCPSILNTSSATLTCSDIFNNAGGDWVSCISDQDTTRNNLSKDPLFCDPTMGDFSIFSQSPCAPDSNTVCGLIGALPVGCP